MITELRQNQNSNGGGLASNITGRFESNRHAIARIEKFTFGEVSAHLKNKKNGGLIISAGDLLEIYTFLFGSPEWHHAGKLPKQYGGGMKKTYFLPEIPTAETVKEWQKKFDEKKAADLEFLKNENLREEKRQKFIKKHGERFYRVLETPKFSFITDEEMNGKYGWFEAQKYRYNLPIYYSGVFFKSKKTLENYFKI